MFTDLTLTITADDVRGWVRRRSELTAEIAQINSRLAAVSILMPAIAELVGPVDLVAATQSTIEPAALHERPMTDLVLWALRNEKGGRDTRWIREHLGGFPEIQPRIDTSPNSVSNATSRLTSRGLLIKDRGLYYLPDLYRKIKTGELSEDRSTDNGHGSFNRMMQELIENHGKRFVAADALELAKHHPVLRDLVTDNPSKVYSWLGRQTFKKRLLKEGEYYALPKSGNELSGSVYSDSSETGGAATPLPNDRQDNDALLG